MKEYFMQIPASALRSEQDIISSWNNYGGKPLVSIVCITYNHENYIEDTIIGFLRQETDFSFEVLIHDDASTDKTADIIKEYEGRYPAIVKPIYQAENQYSKGISPGRFNRERAQGVYIAVCEGDDYWISNSKLRIQKEIMDANPGCAIVYHQALILSNGRFTKWPEVASFDDGIAHINIHDILAVSGQFAPTSSYFYRRELVDLMKRDGHKSPVGDFFIEVYSQKIGSAIYLQDYMSVYRLDAVNNWTSKIRDLEQKFQFDSRQLEFHETIIEDFECVEISHMRVRLDNIKSRIALYHISKFDRDSFIRFINEKGMPRGINLRSQLLLRLASRGRRGVYIAGATIRAIDFLQRIKISLNSILKPINKYITRSL